tara:strand:- start:329 stop:520 length:192 start_codon:yes stop_codon:yes gene_type:complete
MKFKEFAQMSQKERENKLRELKVELVKSKSASAKGLKTKEIKKMIAQILTLNKPDTKGELKKT